ncbi:MAG: polyisoprenoid-binding protein YceI [Planctomycetota bacterium]|jgi:polyisoprenoid-binding protein YceI
MLIKSSALLVLAATLLGFTTIDKSPSSTADAAPVVAKSIGAEDRAKTFKIDAEHSAVLFRVKHMGAGPFWGRFNELSGSFKLDPKAKSGNFVKVMVNAASIDSNSAGRNAHLKKQDFFAVKEFPNITFESTKVTANGDDFDVEGTLEMRGTKKPVKFQARHFGTVKISDRFGLRSGYEAELNIQRGDFGVKYGLKGNMLGNDVKLIIALEGMLSK